MIHRTRGRLGLLLAVGSFCLSLAASASPASAATRVITWNMHSQYANKTEATVGLPPALAPLAGPTGLRSWVVLPDGYSSQRCWPVLYLLHQVGAPDAWLQQQVVYANLPAIVVIPGGGDTWYTNWWNSGARVPGFESWIFNELMPKVSKSFAVCPERNMHAIAGASMGGYGAVYLASQRPDYFGSVGSFSGVLDLADPVIQYGYVAYKQIWGPPGAAYEFGHDPTYLLPNLAHTRVFASVGNGTPISSQSDHSPLAVGLEAEMRNQVTLFRAAAAKAHVPVHFDEHAGTHSQDNADLSLQDFMAYNPFAKVVSSPATWRYSTIDRSGVAWGYHFQFQQQPTTVETFSYSHGTLTGSGSGQVAIQSTDGQHFTAGLPFVLRNGVVRHGNTHTRTFKAKVLPVKVFVRPNIIHRRAPLNVTFTAQKLAPGRRYLLTAFQQIAPSCSLSSFAVAPARVKPGSDVSLTLKPGVGAGHPRHRWCAGHGSVALVTIAGRSVKSAKLVGGAAFLAR